MLNKATLIGRIGKEPDVRTVNGAKVATFSLATSESYKDKEGKRVETTEWHNIVAWRGLAEICEKYVKKGEMLYVEGRIKSRTWEDDKGKHHTTDIVMDNIRLLSSGKKEEKQESKPSEGTPNPPEYIPSPDDLPF